MTRLLTAIIYLFLGIGASFSQSELLDPEVEKLLLQLDTSDSLQVNSLVEDIVNSGSDSNSKAQKLLSLGKRLIVDYQYEKADEVLTLCTQLTSDSLTLADADFQSGLSLMYRDIRLRSLKKFYSALEVYESLKDSLSMGKALDKIADNYNYIGEHERARPFYNTCLTIFTQLKDTSRLTNILGNIGGMMSEENLHDSALYFYEKAMVLNRRAENYSNLSSDLSGMAIAYEGLNKNDEALMYLRECYRAALLSNEDIRLGFSNQHFGYYFYRLKMYDSAKHYMKIANAYGRKMNNAQLLINTMDILHQVAFKNGEFKEAYVLFQASDELQDSLLSLENVSVINSLRSEYEMENQEAENQALSEQALLNAEIIAKQAKLNTTLLISAILLVIATIGLLTLNRNRRKKNKIMQQDRDLIHQQREKLKELDSYKSTFFANIAHDFRAPISLIRGFVDLIKINEPTLKKETQDYIHHIEETTSRLHSMTLEINELVQLQESKYDLKYQEIDINDFFGTIGQMFKSGNRNENITFEYISEVPEGEQLYADKSALEKIIFNILGNAFKYNQTGTSIKMHVVKKDAELEVSVSDDGPGIQQDKINKIFERYYRTDKGAKAAIGLGIGLSLAKDLVDLHGGSINATSVPDQETCFVIVLPLNPKS